MDAQIVDVEGGQVKAAYDDSSWRNRFRRNEVQLDEDEVAYVPLRKADRDAVFYVRLWCRSSRGESLCVVVCDAQREVYRRLFRGSSEVQAAVQTELERRLSQGRRACDARCEVVARAPTAGWQPDPSDDRKPWKAPWMRFRVTNTLELEGVGERGWFSRRQLEAAVDGELSRLVGREGQLFDVQTAHRTLDLRTEVLRLAGLRAGGGLRLRPELLQRLKAPRGLSCASVLQVRWEELEAAELRCMAPLRVLSFDLECCSATDAFPLAHHADDCIITAGLYVRTLGQPDERCTMLCLGDAQEADGAGSAREERRGMHPDEVRCFATEAELLLAFAETLQASDADVVVGYNSCAFDWRYLRDRIELLYLQPCRGDVDLRVGSLLSKRRASLADAKARLQDLSRKDLGGREKPEDLLQRLGCGVQGAEVGAPTAEGAPEDAAALEALRDLFWLPLGELKEQLAGVRQLQGKSLDGLTGALQLLGYEVGPQGVRPWPDPQAAPRRAPPRNLSEVERRCCFRLERRLAAEARPEVEKLASNALGDNVLCYPRLPGRVNLDLWLYLKRENLSDLQNLKLNTVSKHFLGEEKHDLPPKAIFASFREGALGRWRVASYCRQDCKLVLDLLEKMEAIPSIWEMAQVTCTAPEDILFRGQQLKVYTQLVLEALKHDYVVEDRREGPEEETEEQYEGATVVEPEPGYYHEPIFCLDFASLYPSLMRTMNLSPDSLVSPGARVAVEVHEIPIREGVAHRFVRGSVHEGLLPRILEQLLSERKRVKKAMEAETDPRRRALLNSKQLALKVSANSVYGACGALRGRLSCRECAEATTAAGREAINFTCRNISEREGFRIVYGDTDSAFMRIPAAFHAAPLAELFELGERLAREVTQAIRDLTPGEQCHIKLEFEKMLNPLCLYKKKRYTGLCYEDVTKAPKVLTKGLEMVRKDACGLTKLAQERVVRALLELRDPRAAVDVVLEALRSLLAVPPGGPFDVLRQSKSLKAAYKDETSQVHWVVKELMRRREVGSEPRVGDRVEYVVVASLTERVVDKAEDVAYAQAHGLPPDWSHYFEAVERPLMRLLEVPLRAVDPTALDALKETADRLRERARLQTKQHCLARIGLRWEHGHRCKSGAVQMKLTGAPKSFAAPAPGDLGCAPPETQRAKRARKDAAAAAAAAGQRTLFSFRAS